MREPKKKEFIPDPRPNASGRKKPRAGSTGPNGTANKFLASLLGQRVKCRFMTAPHGGEIFTVHGVLREFDSYSMVLDVSADGQKEIPALLFKGPGLLVLPDHDLRKGE